jgi:hypothetical protein
MGSFQSLIPYRRNEHGEATAHALAFRWDVTAHLEAGSITEAGNTAALFKTDEFARAGGRGSLEVLVAPEALNSRLSLGVSYLRYTAFHGDSPNHGLFRATAQWALPFGSGHFSPSTSGLLEERSIIPTLRVEYQKGTLPVTFEEDESLLVGIGILF